MSAEAIENQASGDAEPGPLVVLVDDLRSFRDHRPAVISRTCDAALAYLVDNRRRHIDELWLDHDLGPGGTTGPVVELLQHAAFNDEPFDVGLILVHTANAAAAEWMLLGLRRFGYQARRASTDALISDLVPESE